MSRFFPDPQTVRGLRATCASSTLAEILTVAHADELEVPRERDWREMTQELCQLLEDIGVPDRDGPDLAVIVPLNWNGVSTRRQISVDIGRRALGFARQPESGPTEVNDEIFAEDPDLARNLRDALMPLLVTYKNCEPAGE